MTFAPDSGGCPICGNCDAFLDVDRDHWAVCHAHKVKWLYGSNIFSGWRDMPAELHATNFLTLATYRDARGVAA